MHLREDRTSILSLIRASVLKTAIFAVVFFAIAGAVFCLHGASPALAQGTNFGLSSISGGFTTLSITQIIGNLIKAFLGILGIVALGLVIYGGWLWMTAAGSEEKVVQAKKLLTNAAIGLLIILSAYTIVSYIFSAFENAISGGGAGGAVSQGQEPGGLGGALGNGIIQSHYPARGATDVPRNTSIIVTFKELMDDTTLIAGGKVNSANVQIVTRAQYDAGGTPTPLTAVTTSTVDHKTYVFKPDEFLGSPTESTGYVVILGPGIKKADGKSAFTGSYQNYIWSFEVSTKLDVDPPTVVSVIPLYSNPVTNDSSTNTNIHNKTVARNAIVQINFSEPVNPLMVTGDAPAFTNIVVDNVVPSDNVTGGASGTPAETAIAGHFEISNEYRTVEFVSTEECGVNSCGEKVYCLPGNAQIRVKLKSATLTSNPKPELPFLAVDSTDGITDVANNAMDGNKNGKPDNNTATYDLNIEDPAATKTANPAGDNFQWGFYTNNTVDFVPPKILSYAPVAQSVGVDPNQQLTATFDKLLSSSSVKPDAGYGDGYCKCSVDSDCGQGQICDSSNKCVMSTLNADGGHDQYVCHKHSDGAECKSTVAGADQDATLCVEHEHVTLLQPAGVDAVGYSLMTQNDPNPSISQSTTIMDHVGFVIDQSYGAYYGSGIRDLYQNCYIPNAAPGCPRIGGDSCTTTADCTTKVGSGSTCQSNHTCSYIAGKDWLSSQQFQYPGCDLTQSTLSTYGLFNAGFSTVSNVNKSIQFPAFSWDKTVSYVSGNLSGIDYFKSIPQSNTANIMLYFQQDPAAPGAGNLYLIAYAGKDDSTATDAARQLTLDISSVDGKMTFNASDAVTANAAASIVNGALRVAMSWTDKTHAFAVYPLGSVTTGGPIPALNLQISEAAGTVGLLQAAYPGGVQVIGQQSPLSLSAVDKQPPLVGSGDFEVKYTHDDAAGDYVATVTWDACPAKRDSVQPSTKQCASDVAEAYVDWTFPSNIAQLKSYNLSAQPLNDLGREGDAAAGDLIWTFQFTVPDSAYQDLAAAISGSQVFLDHLSKDYAGNSVQLDGGSPSDPIPATISSQ